MIPVGLFCWTVVRDMRRLDEMYLRIQFEALGFAFAASALLTFTYGFLETVGAPHIRPAYRPASLPMKNRLKELRAERKWSQVDLAERLNVSRQTINAIENERYDPSLPLAFQIARAFEMPIESIFDDGQSVM